MLKRALRSSTKQAVASAPLHKASAPKPRPKPRHVAYLDGTFYDTSKSTLIAKRGAESLMEINDRSGAKKTFFLLRATLVKYQSGPVLQGAIYPLNPAQAVGWARAAQALDELERHLKKLLTLER